MISEDARQLVEELVHDAMQSPAESGETLAAMVTALRLAAEMLWDPATPWAGMREAMGLAVAAAFEGEPRPRDTIGPCAGNA